MVMKRFFRSARGGGGGGTRGIGGVVKRRGAAEASKDSSRDDTFATSCDSQRNCLPQHVGKPGNDALNQQDYDDDDISSILLGESAGSPNTSFRSNTTNKWTNKNKKNTNTNTHTSKYDQNASFVVRSTLETLRIVADVEFDQEGGGMHSPDGTTTMDVLRGRSFGTRTSQRSATVMGQEEELLRTSSPPSSGTKNHWSPLVDYDFEEILPTHPRSSSSTRRGGGNGNGNGGGGYSHGPHHDDKTYSSTVDGTMEAGDVEIFNPHESASAVSTEMSLFCLSLLEEHCDEVHGDMALSVAERIVQESLKHNLMYGVGGGGGGTTTTTTTRRTRSATMAKASSTTGGTKKPLLLDRNGDDDDECLDLAQMEEWAKKFTAEGKYSQAIRLYRKVLDLQKVFPDAETTAETYSRLLILHLCEGDTTRAIRYGKKALQMNREESRPAQSAMCLLSVGLAYLGANRPEKALTTWREALQTLCQVYGYDHPYVAVLLNNLGCLHYLEGNLAASVKALSESLEMQRKFLRSSLGTTSINLILLDMAVTSANVAMIEAKTGDIESATALFEEVLSLQESVLADRDHPLLQQTRYTMHRLAAVSSLVQRDVSSSSTTSTRGGGGSNYLPFGTTAVSASPNSKRTQGASDMAQHDYHNNSNSYNHHHHHHPNGMSLPPSVFGDTDGIPLRRAGAKSPLDAMDSTDNWDVILLGSLECEYTPRQRVRAAVLAWFGKTLQDDVEDPKLFPVVPFGGGALRKRTRVPVDVDHENVLDAEFYLDGVYEQATEHLEVRSEK
jgi:tetratricopeptide (TPR) repeat protein